MLYGSRDSEREMEHQREPRTDAIITHIAPSCMALRLLESRK